MWSKVQRLLLRCSVCRCAKLAETCPDEMSRLFMMVSVRRLTLFSLLPLRIKFLIIITLTDPSAPTNPETQMQQHSTSHSRERTPSLKSIAMRLPVHCDVTVWTDWFSRLCRIAVLQRLWLRPLLGGIMSCEGYNLQSRWSDEWRLISGLRSISAEQTGQISFAWALCCSSWYMKEILQYTQNRKLSNWLFHSPNSIF